MITKKTTMCSCQGHTRESAEYYGKSTDVVENGDGTYSVIGVTCLNADVFYAMDTGLVLMCDGETGKWYKQ